MKISECDHEYIETRDTCPDEVQSSSGSGHPHIAADDSIYDSFQPVATAEVLDTVGIDEVGFPARLTCPQGL